MDSEFTLWLGYIMAFTDCIVCPDNPRKELRDGMMKHLLDFYSNENTRIDPTRFYLFCRDVPTLKYKYLPTITPLSGISSLCNKIIEDMKNPDIISWLCGQGKLSEMTFYVFNTTGQFIYYDEIAKEYNR